MIDHLETFNRKTAEVLGQHPDFHSGLCLTLDDQNNLAMMNMTDEKRKKIVVGIHSSGGC